MMIEFLKIECLIYQSLNVYIINLITFISSLFGSLHFKQKNKQQEIH